MPLRPCILQWIWKIWKIRHQNGPKRAQFYWFSKNIQKHVVFDDFLLQKAVSVDSFSKMDAKCLRPGFGLGRAGWAGLGWLGWAGLAGLPGLPCWAGWAGLGWAGTLSGTSFVDFWSQGQKVIKSSLLGLVFSTSGANARKSLNRASWDSFCRLLEPRLESHQIELLGTGFLDFWSQRQKVFKSSFLGFF